MSLVVARGSLCVTLLLSSFSLPNESNVHPRSNPTVSDSELNMNAPQSHNNPDRSSQEILEPPYDQAVRFGLRPYSDFAKELGPAFSRVAPGERRCISAGNL